MGGSGGSIPTGRAGGDGGIQELNCPRKFETYLVDVFQTGNADYAINLKPGIELHVEPAKLGGIAIVHDSRVIGYLPANYDMIIDCMSSGWNYSALIVDITGDKNAPRIKVSLIGAP